MKSLTPLFLSAAIFAAASAVASVASATASMPMPKCASNDPVVMVNTQTKTYMMYQKTASMNMPSHTQLMCKSKAAAMGAHMSKSMPMHSSMHMAKPSAMPMSPSAPKSPAHAMTPPAPKSSLVPVPSATPTLAN